MSADSSGCRPAGNARRSPRASVANRIEAEAPCAPARIRREPTSAWRAQTCRPAARRYSPPSATTVLRCGWSLRRQALDADLHRRLAAPADRQDVPGAAAGRFPAARRRPDADLRSHARGGRARAGERTIADYLPRLAVRASITDVEEPDGAVRPADPRRWRRQGGRHRACGRSSDSSRSPRRSAS